MIEHRLMNDEALSSPIYNPNIDQNTADLYNLMAPTASNPEDTETLAPYVEQIESLPTVNVFAGVLINPRQCDIAELIDIYTEIRVMIPEIREDLPIGGQPDWDEVMPDVESDIDDIETITAALQTHTDRLTANIMQVVGIAQAAMGLATALESLANPCLGRNNFLGSIMDKGRELMAGARTEIAKVRTELQKLQADINEELAPILAEIQSAMAAAKSIMNDVQTMIQNEVLNLAKGLLGQDRLSLAEFMTFLKTNPCLKALGGLLGSSQAGSILGRL